MTFSQTATSSQISTTSKTRKYETCSIYVCIHSRIQAAYSLYAAVSVGLQTSPTCWDKSRIPDQARSQSYFLLDHWLIRSQPLHVSLLYTSTRLIHVPYTRLPLHSKILRPQGQLNSRIADPAGLVVSTKCPDPDLT